MPPTRPDPCRHRDSRLIAALCFCEQMIVWSIRMRLAAPDDECAVRHTLCRACGRGAGAVAATWLDYALRLLSQAARRPVLIYPLARDEVAPGEQLILDLVAATQHDDRRHAETQARALLPTPMDACLLEATAMLGAALAAAGRIVPPRYALPQPSDSIH